MKINSEKIKYLIIGAINSIMGYLLGILVYLLLNESIGIFGVGVVGSIVSITFSFMMYKMFVFNTSKGNLLIEYFRAYVVYGLTAFLGVILLYIFVQKMGFTIWISQGLVIFCTFIFSYIGHKRFTFLMKI